MEARRRLFDDLSKIATSAAGVVQGASQEVEQMVRQRFEKLVDSLDFVTREEFDAVKAMAETARRENEALEKRIKALEPAKPASAKGAKSKTARSKATSRKTTGKSAKTSAKEAGKKSKK